MDRGGSRSGGRRAVISLTSTQEAQDQGYQAESGVATDPHGDRELGAGGPLLASATSPLGLMAKLKL